LEKKQLNFTTKKKKKKKKKREREREREQCCTEPWF